MKSCLLAIGLWLCAAAAPAGNTNYFAFTNSIGQPISDTTVTLTPTSPQVVNGFNGNDALQFTTTNDGSFLVTNLLPGSYYVRENNSFFIVTEPSGNGFFFMQTNVSGILAAGSTAVYTRAQSDARYYQVTNAGITGETSSNTTFVGWANGNGVIWSNGYFIGATNVSSIISNATFLGANSFAGSTNSGGLFESPVENGGVYSNADFPTAVIFPLATNWATYSTNFTLSWSPIGLGASSIQTIAAPSAWQIGTNSNWEITIIPRNDVAASVTDMVFSAWVSATNTITVQAADASATINDVPVTGPYRITARQWQ